LLSPRTCPHCGRPQDDLRRRSSRTGRRPSGSPYSTEVSDEFAGRGRLVRSASARGEEAVWSLLYGRMSAELCASIDGLLSVSEGRSALVQLKQYPPDAKPGPIRAYLERVALLQTIGAGALDLSGVDPETIARLAALTRRYDVKELRRFAPAKRYALVVCFL